MRGLSPFPGAFFEADLGRGVERVKVLRARVEEGAGAPGAALDDDGLIACGEGALRLLRVQRAGKGEMEFEEFLRGRKLRAAWRSHDFDARGALITLPSRRERRPAKRAGVA